MTEEQMQQATAWITNHPDMPDEIKQQFLNGIAAYRLRHERLVNVAFNHPLNQMTKQELSETPLPVLERMLSFVNAIDDFPDSKPHKLNGHAK
jgi:hypothetical protein